MVETLESGLLLPIAATPSYASKAFSRLRTSPVRLPYTIHVRPSETRLLISALRKRIAWLQAKAEGAVTYRREEGLKVPLYLKLLASKKYQRLYGYVNPYPTRAVDKSVDVSLNPLPIVARPRAATLNLVMETFDRDSLDAFGLMAVAFAGIWSRRLGAPLRLVTRDGPGDRDLLGKLTRLNELDSSDTSVAYAAADLSEGPIATTPSDLFITTSWQSTAATLATIPPKRVFYLVQGNEAPYSGGGALPAGLTDVFADTSVKKLVGGKPLWDKILGLGLPLDAVSAATFEPPYALLLASLSSGDLSRRETPIVDGDAVRPTTKDGMSMIAEVEETQEADPLGLRELEKSVQTLFNFLGDESLHV